MVRSSSLFHQLLQALIELADRGTQERSLLESISKHVAERRQVTEETPPTYWSVAEG